MHSGVDVDKFHREYNIWLDLPTINNNDIDYRGGQ